MHSQLKHIITLFVLAGYMLLMAVMNAKSGPPSNFDPWKEYGVLGTVVLYILRSLAVIPLPLVICNFIGIVCFNTHPLKPVLKASVLFGPFLCFRVVTRGTYPSLVKRNIEKNVEKCLKLGLTNFVFEIATDTSIGITNSGQVRQIVIPDEYQTKKGTLYKARALQYCLEDGVNILSDTDWLIHLDEETLITENSLIGIINFINDGRYQFGQGVITYASEEIVNWVTTLSDSVRVGMDYGILRFSLGILHRPLFSWKGSFIVANVHAERSITYDFGKEGSIAEDCFFALNAWKDGYKFGWIEGEMLEKSPFSIMDFIRQRKRWVQGIRNALFSSNIPLQYKLGIFNVMLAWFSMPLSSLNLIMIPLFPIPLPYFLNLITSSIGGIFMFLFTFGASKSFSRKRFFFFPGLLVFLMLIIVPITTILETIAILWSILSRQKGFHVVKKDVHESPILSHV